MNSKGLLNKGIIQKVRKRHHISFRFDNWVESRSLIDILGIKETNIPNLDIKIGDFITQEAQ